MIKNNNSVSNSNSKSGPNTSANLSSKTMSAQSISKKHFSYYKFVIYSFLFIILILPMVVVFSTSYTGQLFPAMKSTPGDYYYVPYINPTEECKVANSSAVLSYMVPIKTATEWIAFRTADSRLADLSVSCLTPCTPKTCADLTGMATVNGGYNCGQGLSDGCGGTLDCYSNCAWDEICSAGNIGGECALGYSGSCLDTQGHCRVDNGCVPVIAVESYDSLHYGRIGCLMYGLEGGFSEASIACTAPINTGAQFPMIMVQNGSCYIDIDGAGPTGQCYSFLPDATPTPYNIIGYDDGISYEGYYNANDQMFYTCQDAPTPPPLTSCTDYCVYSLGFDLAWCQSTCGEY